MDGKPVAVEGVQFRQGGYAEMRGQALCRTLEFLHILQSGFDDTDLPCDILCQGVLAEGGRRGVKQPIVEDVRKELDLQKQGLQGQDMIAFLGCRGREQAVSFLPEGLEKELLS